MKNTRFSRLLLKFGVLGLFVYAALVALGSFVLFGCWCLPERPWLRPAPPATKSEAEPAPPIPDAPSKKD